MDIYSLFKKIAFKIDPEEVHEFTIKFAHFFPEAAYAFNQFNLSDKYSVKTSSMNWNFPVGLAAGLDKNAVAIEFFEKLFFGAVEVGTVTPLPQAGNPRPRLFRLVEHSSLLNRMGFNNQGSDAVLSHIKSIKRSRPLGINIGKNKWTSEDQSIEEYKSLYQKFSSLADYLVINVSSPNTPGLRNLQNKDYLERLLSELAPLRRLMPCPLFIKIAPELNFDQVDDVLIIAQDFKLDGLIATNTTNMPEVGQGGVSGMMLRERSEKVRTYLLSQTINSNIDIICVGGIDCFEDLWKIWSQGGRLCQIYSSFIYQGPQVLMKIKQGIDQKLIERNCKNVDELISSILS